MELVPSQEDVINLLLETGALRYGHFVYPNGMHSNQYLQVPLAMRKYQHAKTLSVGLSRLLRANTEIRALLPEVAIIAPATGGLPVAYGVGEALRAHQVYWAEEEGDNKRLRFRQFFELERGEKVILVDDLLRGGAKMKQLVDLVTASGGEVVAIGVVVFQPTPNTCDFSPIPFYYLAKLERTYHTNGDACDVATRGAEPIKIRV